MTEKLEYVKFRERLDFAIELIKEKTKREELTETLLISAIEIAKCLFVRSEIQYSKKT